ncbi:MAG: dihydrolipoyl dehydrogenase, partial [Planctomycetota bacterium]|nr:dihydrolipoyl dehydrogenase [Planctomycetota bacterium]
LGKSVLLAERDKLGGTCLNRGCVPTKSFLNAAKLYHHAVSSEVFGVTVQSAAFDYARMKARTEKVQETLRGAVAGMMRRRKVEILAGEAVILDRNRVQVGGKTYEGANLLVAAGSRPAMPPIPGLKDNPAVVDSTGILGLPRLAGSLAVIGGGVVGIEFACFYSLLGVKVSVVEMLPQICGNIDREISVTLQRKLESRGVAVHTGAAVKKMDGGEIFFADREGKPQTVKADLVLVAAGRTPNLEGYGLENLNLDADRSGVRVNGKAETSLPRVYAAGDVAGRMQLAHFAARQGAVAAENMFGGSAVCREIAVPAVVYTDPEIAVVGLTGEQAKERGLAARSLKMPLGASGRFLAETEGERGFVKAVLGERGVLLGMHVVGPYASEMIGAACVMIENEMRAGDIRELVFPHPTVGELMRDVMSM